VPVVTRQVAAGNVWIAPTDTGPMIPHVSFAPVIGPAFASWRPRG